MSLIQIAIDGPAGAGKSTIARIVAQQLGYLYIDSGAMYRTITYAALEKGISCRDEKQLARLAAETEIRFWPSDTGEQLVFCDGLDVTALIRKPEVSNKVSLVAAHPAVRNVLVNKQRAYAERSNVVMDGRDIGTVVLPKAECKIFLTAKLAERAKRRQLELIEKGYAQEYEVILAEMKRRDELDQNREAGPLLKADDAVVIDTTNLSLTEVVAEIMKIQLTKKV